MWEIVSGIVGALIVHGVLWGIRRRREVREERRRLELFAMLYDIAPKDGESNAALRARMTELIRGVGKKPGLPAWLKTMQENGESWMKKHGNRR